MNDWSFSLSASVFFTANKIETQGKNSAHRIFAKGDMITSLPLSTMGFSHSSKGFYLRPGDFNFSVGLVLGWVSVLALVLDLGLGLGLVLRPGDLFFYLSEAQKSKQTQTQSLN